MHLPTAGLRQTEVNGVPKPLEHLHDRYTSLGEKRVVVAGNEERDPQNLLPIGWKTSGCNCSMMLLGRRWAMSVAALQGSGDCLLRQRPHHFIAGCIRVKTIVGQILFEHLFVIEHC